MSDHRIGRCGAWPQPATGASLFARAAATGAAAGARCAYRVSSRNVARCGRVASTPSRSTLFFS